MCSVCGLVRLKAIFCHNEQVQSIQIQGKFGYFKERDSPLEMR